MKPDKTKQMTNSKGQTTTKSMPLCIYASLYLLIIALTLFLTSTPINAEVIDGRFYPVPVETKTAEVITAPKSIDTLVGNFDHKINFVFSDIDGTLIPFNKTGPRAVVPESVKQTAQKLKKTQIPLMLVTGRSGSEAIQIYKRLETNNSSYLIAQQGAQILNSEGRIIYENNIDHKNSIKIFKSIEEFEKTNHRNLKLYFYFSGDLYTISKFDMPYIIQKSIAINSLKDLSKINPNYTLSSIGIYSYDMQDLKAVQAFLKKKYPKYNIDIAADCYCSITSPSATKGNAVKKLAEILKIDLKYAAVLGDAENDISMLKEVKQHGGLAIAIGNALPPVKTSANYVTAPVTEDGFAKAVDKILENNAVIH